ncbi:MAG: hypothetical protein ABFS34_05670 [Gemmatimonadota bacterium]
MGGGLSAVRQVRQIAASSTGVSMNDFVNEALERATEDLVPA